MSTPRPRADTHRYRLIKQAFAGKGLTFASIARELKVTASAVTHVAQGRRVSRRVRSALAQRVGVSYGDLWEA